MVMANVCKEASILPDHHGFKQEIGTLIGEIKDLNEQPPSKFKKRLYEWHFKNPDGQQDLPQQSQTYNLPGYGFPVIGEQERDKYQHDHSQQSPEEICHAEMKLLF